ncbi:NAD(P)H-binding protein [Agrobacterium vitis]|uniref:NAD(P)H-binding protein n=1 Tax=Agrobacterium vitis TaxID=373 RepID=UPI0015722232|nr:NAD(P)H-binding protein [Agrobacterium vitis]NSZ19827.1 NAD(P)H-binding protein [Agrobacterium vitis]QZO07264.1 NAD(P)H-binding protein [Agrobacterium vitis]UJL91026.1 NAD(P)H-binding protein [Agrobacterium vitis]
MIVITAPTGNIGSQVLANILDSGERIRVIARDPSKLPSRVLNQVEVVEGSHSDATVVKEAFLGADQVFWLVPADPRAPSAESAYLHFSRPACEALKTSGVKHVVAISALGCGWPKDAGHVTAALKMDDLFASTGVSYRALACASLMENVLRQAALIRDRSAFYWPTAAEIKEPACATRDVAALAAHLLLSPSWTGVESIPMLGPEDISFNEMMAIISYVIGKPVQYHLMAMDDLKAMMIKRGASDGMAQAMVNMMTAKNEGMDRLLKRTLSHSSDTPTSFRRWCEEVLKPALVG